MAKTIKKLPFPDWLLQVPCKITLYSGGVGRNGEPNVGISWSGKCIFSEKAERILNTDGKYINLFGKVIVKGDIAPSLKNVSDGEITINSTSYNIYRGYRPRNPDGTIHHTEFELR